MPKLVADYIKLLKTFPTKRVAVSVLLFNTDNKILVLKPGYKDDWTLPGGVVEANESPLEAAKREAKEEISVKIKIDKCLSIDYSQKVYENYHDESLQIMFLGNIMSESDVKTLKIDNSEIVDFKFVKIKEAIEMLNKHLSDRLNSLNGDFDRFIFLENGKHII
jgi:ADP-ribose pyrophosphatase YjhB (NUDIX family)